jgi:hypothetical protein
MQAKLKIVTSADLACAFGNLRTEVGPRMGGNARTHDHKEWWYLRSYIFTLAGSDGFSSPF